MRFNLLKRYGLENKLVSANLKKQDFHAKFFIGLAAEGCEVLSGSANLVRGPSLENIVFRAMTMDRCQSRYLYPMKVTLPVVTGRNRQFVLIEECPAGEWGSRDSSGCPLSVTVVGSEKSA